MFHSRRVVPVILEDGSENLSALDSALQDRTAQDWVSPALTGSPTFQLHCVLKLMLFEPVL